MSEALSSIERVDLPDGLCEQIGRLAATLTELARQGHGDSDQASAIKRNIEMQLM